MLEQELDTEPVVIYGESRLHRLSEELVPRTHRLLGRDGLARDDTAEAAARGAQ